MTTEVRDLWFFEVDDSGTIVESDAEDPKIRSDVYDNIWYGKTPKDLIDEVDSYDELRSHFQSLAANELEVVDAALDAEEETGAERVRLLALQGALQDEDDGWQAWVRLGGLEELPRFQAAVDQWLAEPIEWSWSEFWPQGWSSQGKALVFFQDLDRDIIDNLGVVIIEGEHPGSTYYAAELRTPIAKANDVAEQLGLPFRFRRSTA